MSCDCLKRVIKEQLQQEILPDIHSFDVGFIQGSNVVSIRSIEDLRELWSDMLQSASKTVLWCDGLQKEIVSTGQQKHGLEYDSDDENGPSKRKKAKLSKEDKEDRVQDIVDHFKVQHGSKYTPMQLRIWAEMLVSGMYSSRDNPPNTTMFTRASGHSKKPREESPSADSVTKAFTDAACAITNVLSPKSNAILQNSSGCSPVKTIESRSKLYKQLGELNNLKSSGVLTLEEYLSEKQAIMNLLKEINSRN